LSSDNNYFSFVNLCYPLPPTNKTPNTVIKFNTALSRITAFYAGFIDIVESSGGLSGLLRYTRNDRHWLRLDKHGARSEATKQLVYFGEANPEILV